MPYTNAQSCTIISNVVHQFMTIRIVRRFIRFENSFLLSAHCRPLASQLRRRRRQHFQFAQLCKRTAGVRQARVVSYGHRKHHPCCAQAHSNLVSTPTIRVHHIFAARSRTHSCSWAKRVEHIQFMRSARATNTIGCDNIALVCKLWCWNSQRKVNQLQLAVEYFVCKQTKRMIWTCVDSKKNDGRSASVFVLCMLSFQRIKLFKHTYIKHAISEEVHILNVEALVRRHEQGKLTRFTPTDYYNIWRCA